MPEVPPGSPGSLASPGFLVSGGDSDDMTSPQKKGNVIDSDEDGDDDVASKKKRNVVSKNSDDEDDIDDVAPKKKGNVSNNSDDRDDIDDVTPKKKGNVSKNSDDRDDIDDVAPKKKGNVSKNSDDEDDDDLDDEDNIKNTNGLHMDERSLLNNFFEEILKTSSVDYSCSEIEDIQTAVLELMERIAVKVNERGLFNISRIEPCGSMAEKAALWKTYTEEDTENDTENYGMETVSEKYLEFDFLAVLAKTDDIKLLMQDCKGCNKVHGSLLNNTLLQKYGYIEMLRNSKWKGVNINNTHIIDRMFQREVCASIVSLCNCWTIQGEFYDNCFKDLPGSSYTLKFYHSSAGCTECSISRASGTLKIAPGPDDTRDCTLILQWKSKSSSLFAPVGYSINQTQNMKRFPIHIDFIAALETLQETQQGDTQTVDTKSFIVSKRCSVCRHYKMWRISGCIEEISAIKNEFSTKHKKCYMILKYIFQTGEISYYMMKTAVLHHHTTCTDTSEDMVACITTILQELDDASKRGHLQAYCRPVNLLCRSGLSRNKDLNFKKSFLLSMHKLDSFKPYRHAFEKLVWKDIRT